MRAERKDLTGQNTQTSPRVRDRTRTRRTLLWGASLLAFALVPLPPIATAEDPKPGTGLDSGYPATMNAAHADEYERLANAFLALERSHPGKIAWWTAPTNESALVPVVLTKRANKAVEVPELTQLASDVAPSLQLTFSESPRDLSLTELNQLRSQILADRALLMGKGVTVTSAWTNHLAGRVVVTIDSDPGTARAALAAAYGDSVEIMSGGGFKTHARHSDIPNYYGGIPLDVPLGGLYPDCSSGFAVVKPGYGNYMLTAGHCVGFSTGISFYTHGTYIGYSGATDMNADGALVTGGYSPRVWTGSATGSTVLPINGVTPTEVLNMVVCNDGAKSGLVCRNSITDLEYLTPQGARAVIACNTSGWVPSQPGDSGAPVIRSTSTGVIYGHGIDNGAFDPPYQNCFAYVPMWKITERLGVYLRTV